MITLNLNKPEIKIKYKNNLVYHKLLDVCFLILSTMIIICLILYIAQIGLQNEQDRIGHQIQEIQSKAVGQELEQLKDKTTNLNNLLKNIDFAQKKDINFFNYLQIINQTIPSNIQLDQISILSANKNWQIKGRAKDRDTLDRLEDTINNSDSFTNIDFPIPNITLKENIPFQISGLFKEK